MPNKPDLLKWVTDDDASKIVDPGSTKKLNGFLYKEKPAFQFINYLFNSIFKWLRGLQGNYSNIVVGSSSQVSTYDATHTIDQLNDSSVPSGSQLTFLSGTHTLSANKTLSNDDCFFRFEPGAVLGAGIRNLTLNGARCFGNIGLSAGGSLVSVNGDRSLLIVDGYLNLGEKRNGQFITGLLAPGGYEEGVLVIGGSFSPVLMVVMGTATEPSGRGKWEATWTSPNGNANGHAVGADTNTMIGSMPSASITPGTVNIRVYNRNNISQVVAISWASFPYT